MNKFSMTQNLSVFLMQIPYVLPICLKFEVLLKLMFVLHKDGREFKMHAVREIQRKVRGGFIASFCYIFGRIEKV